MRLHSTGRACGAVGMVVAFVLGFAQPGRAAGIADKDCFECHADKAMVKTNAGKAVSLFVDASVFKASAHGGASCTDCHTDIKELPHADQLAPVDCAGCHDDAAKVFRASAHGQAPKKPGAIFVTCLSCHGKPHDIRDAKDTNSPVFYANIPGTCATCHGHDDAMAPFKLAKSSVVASYEQSVHGLALKNGGKQHVAVCTDCHGAHDVLQTGNTRSKLYWQNVPATCGKCHADVDTAFERSIHGIAARGNHRDAPVCTDCHGEHTIAAVKLADSSVSTAHITETCGQCHKAERIGVRYGFQTQVFDTYVESFHGLATGIGGVSAANCASCHGFHDILPSSDPASSVNRANLPATCGKCHPGIGTRLATGELKIHQPPGKGEGPKDWIVALVTRIYIILIVVVIGGMLVHNLADFLVKMRAHIRHVRFHPGEMRMTRVMRAQHFCLILTFVLLAYTGFVHKFPEAWWSWPFRALPDGSHWRGLLHRIAGWVFTGVFALHLVLLFGTARGRLYLGQLWLKKHDGTDFFRGVGSYLRFRAPALPHRRFNFAEKAEYWALVWGSFVMIVTGVMLIFSEAVLRFLPKVWLDLAQVIHLYEAVLATLAIVVWHFYWVIFDPNEYPVNPAWLVGHKAKHKGGEDELE